MQADVYTGMGLFRAAVPSGASTGIHEAAELRDGDSGRYGGKGVLKAVASVNGVLSSKLKGFDVTAQASVDAAMCELDGTANKTKLGANAILAVSMAVAKAGAAAAKKPLYRHFAHLAGREALVMPVPFANVINGGVHASNALAMQEFMIAPVGAASFSEGLRMVCETYAVLKGLLKKKYGLSATGVGDEGGFAPQVQSNEEGLVVLQEAIAKAGYEGVMKLAMDVAASELYTKAGAYDLNFKVQPNDGSQVISGKQLLELYAGFAAKYPIVSIEDPFDQDDWPHWSAITARLNSSVQIVGDDLLCTNPKRIVDGIKQKACGALLLKVNQIGTITESIRAALDSQSAGWGVMVSHRSGETEDATIAHLAVGLGAGQIKTGAPCRSERTAKYNELCVHAALAKGGRRLHPCTALLPPSRSLVRASRPPPLSSSSSSAASAFRKRAMRPTLARTSARRGSEREDNGAAGGGGEGGGGGGGGVFFFR